MQTALPIRQEDGKPFPHLSAFRTHFYEEKKGRYLLGSGDTWHGGVHITSECFPWGINLQPIRAIADGKLVAYRASNEYQHSEFQEKCFEFSNNFLILQHEMINPDQGDDIFVYYSLYMHLRPLGKLQQQAQYALTANRNFRTEDNEGSVSHNSAVLMPLGTVFEIDNESPLQDVTVGRKVYECVKCAIKKVGTFDTSRANWEAEQNKADNATNQTLWFAVNEKDGNKNGILNAEATCVVADQRPQWHSQIETIELDKVVQLDGNISVSADEAIGFMGYHSSPKGLNGQVRDNYRVHIEVFSPESIPDFAVELLGKKETIRFIDASDSDGVFSASSPLYKALAEAVGVNDEITDSDITNYLRRVSENKKNELEHLAVYHPSEWLTDGNPLLIAVQRELDRKELQLKRCFYTDEAFDGSRERQTLLDGFKLLIDFEKVRINQLIYPLVQVVNNSIGQSLSNKAVWHYWPFMSVKTNELISYDVMKKLFPLAQENKREEVRKLFNSYAPVFSIVTKSQIAQFMAQIRAEVGSTLTGNEESLFYSVSSLKSTFKRYFNTYPEEADILGYIRITSDEYSKFNDIEKDDYTLMGSYYYQQFPDQQEIAKRVYSCPNGGFELIKGGHESGIHYKGRGFIQLTWKANYEAVKNVVDNKDIDIDFDILENPELLSTDTEIGFIGALGFWSWKNLIDFDNATVSDTDKITDVVNKNTTSRPDRRKYFLEAWNVLNEE